MKSDVGILYTGAEEFRVSGAEWARLHRPRAAVMRWAPIHYPWDLIPQPSLITAFSTNRWVGRTGRGEEIVDEKCAHDGIGHLLLSQALNARILLSRSLSASCLAIQRICEGQQMTATRILLEHFKVAALEAILQ